MVKMEKKKNDNKQAPAGNVLRKYLPVIIAPLAVMAVVFFVYWQYGFYPFGTRTIAWADMNQQVVPLLCQFKDILEGNGTNGMFLSFKNSSGMNFWGVFFFFLSSPLSLLVVFVRKQDMLIFMNILVVVKMMISAATACFYFIRSRMKFSLGTVELTLLGFIYAVCGYTMLFYQNIIWLDVMYLFPLLLLSLEKLLDRKKGSPVPYTLLMAAMVTVNYYLGYMIVVFVLLFMGVYAIMMIKGRQETKSGAFADFLIGSGIAALLSAVVWLPSFMQYLTSGRKTSLYDNLRSGEFITDYKTVYPVMICSAVMLMLAFIGARLMNKDPKLPERERALRRHSLIMTALMLVPIFIEPINKMWHTGSYMAFPSRYGFITVFMVMTLAARGLSAEHRYGGDKLNCMIWTAEGIVVIAMYGYLTAKFINISIDDISAYTQGLNGTEYSFKGFMRLLLIGLLICVSVYITYRKGFIPKKIFLFLLAFLTFFETANNAHIYMTSSGIESEDTYALQREITKLSDRIEDDSFYRVKTNAKIFDYNMIGAMNYDSIGSYTSLNDQDYLFTMKRLGYTSVWMEIGTCGGTELTDSMLSIGYRIDHDKRSDTIFNLGSYNINKLPDKLPLGICLEPSALPAEKDIPEELDRAGVQSYLSQTLFGEDMIERFEPDEGEYALTDEGKYSISEDDIFVYRIHVDGRKTLYFDCFDRLSTDLSEEQYESFLVQANGKTISKAYPFSKENGVLKLGTFKDENVIIQLTALQDVECRSFGIFSLDTEALHNAVSETQACDLHEIKNGAEGTADLDSPKTVLLSIPYNEGFTVTVNGESVSYREVLSSFMAFDLPAGHSDIKISFRPRGFTGGLIMSAAGVLAFAAFVLFTKRRKLPDVHEATDEKKAFTYRVGCYLTAAFGIMIFLLVYVMPILLNILFWKPEKK